MLQILDTGISSAKDNMRLDKELLDELCSHPILHLYQWEPMAATYGYFARPENHLDLSYAQACGLDLARRPTGGGIVFHIWDLAFSFLLPSSHNKFSLNTLENYQFVNQVILESVKKYFGLAPELTEKDGVLLGEGCQNFCMARPTQYDVVYSGMKIAGAAQRRRRQGYLHQGTISLGVPDFDFLRKILKENVVEAMRDYTFSPVKNLAQLKQVRKDLECLLSVRFQEALEK